jgi:hypothetical protein
VDLDGAALEVAIGLLEAIFDPPSEEEAAEILSKDCRARVLLFFGPKFGPEPLVHIGHVGTLDAAMKIAEQYMSNHPEFDRVEVKEVEDGES